MSLVFNDTSTYKGIVQMYEKECGFNRGDISGSTDALKELAADVNLAFDDFWAIAIPASGKWQIDDSNHTDSPIIYTNLVSGQVDYSISTDANSNLVLDIYRVAILPSATATIYQEIYPIDAQSGVDGDNLVSGDTTGGVPAQYDKTGNGIFLDPRPNYNATNGLKLYINREASYVVYTATTAWKPGVPGIFHEYFVIKPSLKYAGRKNLANYKDLLFRVTKMETDIKYYFSGRDRGMKRSMSPFNESCK